MSTYAYLNFLPGGAGNFVSRTLNLCDRVYCWADESTGLVPTTLEEKQLLLGYPEVRSDNWCDWEHQLTHYHKVIDHWTVEPDAVSIWLGHHNDVRQMDLAGPDDTEVAFQITHQNHPELVEWTLFNAWNKQSYWSQDILEAYKRQSEDKSVIKINLQSFFAWSTYSLEYDRICNLLGIDYSRMHMDAVEEMWNSWWNTTLKFEEFDEYKKRINWVL